MTDNVSSEAESNSYEDELNTLKVRADMMGIKYHPNTGLDKLKAKLNNALSGNPNSPQKASKSASEPLTQAEYKSLLTKDRMRNASALIRVRVTCMNPDKKAWEGEIISVGSAKLGTFKKYVPFNTDEGWHIPYIMYEFMKGRKFSQRYTIKDNRGNDITRTKLVPEFSIEVLPPLSESELRELARKQALAGSIDKD